MRNKNKFPRQNKNSFTLIELLVVMVIISILASILLSGVSMARERGKRASCLNNLRQIHMALVSYAADWYGYFPPLQGFSPTADIYNDFKYSSTWVQLGLLYSRGYVDNSKVFYCPSERGNFTYEREWVDNNTASSATLINGGYDSWTSWSLSATARNNIREPAGRAIVGDLNISWGNTFLNLSTVQRFKKTHVGEGQNVLHIGGDVQWYPREVTRNSNNFYQGVPRKSSDFDCVDED